MTAAENEPPPMTQKTAIAANELRIGNWIIIDNKERPAYYYQVTAHDIEEIEECGDDSFSIELTTDILEKACWLFRMNSYGAYTNQWRHKKTDPVVLVQQKDWFLVKTTSGAKLTSIKYVHQLQNLFYVICGEELPLTL